MGVGDGEVNSSDKGPSNTLVPDHNAALRDDANSRPAVSTSIRGAVENSSGATETQEYASGLESPSTAYDSTAQRTRVTDAAVVKGTPSEASEGRPTKYTATATEPFALPHAVPSLTKKEVGIDQSAVPQVLNPAAPTKASVSASNIEGGNNAGSSTGVSGGRSVLPEPLARSSVVSKGGPETVIGTIASTTSEGVVKQVDVNPLSKQQVGNPLVAGSDAGNLKTSVAPVGERNERASDARGPSGVIPETSLPTKANMNFKGESSTNPADRARLGTPASTDHVGLAPRTDFSRNEASSPATNSRSLVDEKGKPVSESPVAKSPVVARQETSVGAAIAGSLPGKENVTTRPAVDSFATQKQEGANSTGIKSGGAVEVGPKVEPSSTVGKPEPTGHSPSEGGRTSDGKPLDPEVKASTEIGTRSQPPSSTTDGAKIPPVKADGVKVSSQGEASPSNGVKAPAETGAEKQPATSNIDGGKVPPAKADGAKPDGAKVPLPGDGRPNSGEVKAPADGISSQPPSSKTEAGKVGPAKSDGAKAPGADGTRAPGVVSPDGIKSPGSAPVGEGAKPTGVKIPGAGPRGDSAGVGVPDTKKPVDSSKVPTSLGPKGVGTRGDINGDGRATSIGGKVSKGPVVGTDSGGNRSNVPERIDPRAGKEKAVAQPDPGTHVVDGRTVKGAREAEIGTRTPVRRGDSREPIEPSGRTDKSVKVESNSVGDKGSNRPNTDGAGKTKPGEVNASSDVRTPLTGTSKPAEGVKDSAIKAGEISASTDVRTPLTGISKSPEGAKGSAVKDVKVTEGSQTSGTKSGGDAKNSPEPKSGSVDAQNNAETKGVKNIALGNEQAGFKIGDPKGVSASDRTGPSGSDQIGQKGRGEKGFTGIKDGLPSGDSKTFVLTGPLTLTPRSADGATRQLSEAIRAVLNTKFPFRMDVPKSIPFVREPGSKVMTARFDNARLDAPKLSTSPADRNDPTIAKIQRDNPRGTVNGAKAEQVSAARSDKLPADRQPLGRTDAARTTGLERVANADRGAQSVGENTKGLTLKLLITPRVSPDTTLPAKDASLEPTLILTVAKRPPGGIIEFPVSKIALDSVRVAPRVNLDQAKLNSRVGKLDFEPTLPRSAETKTFAKHQPDGTPVKSPQLETPKTVPVDSAARGGTERVENLFPKRRSESAEAKNVPSDMVPHSIRDVFLKFQLALPKRSFRPEITDSGSYVAQSGQSSKRLDAFVSSGQHKALKSKSELDNVAADRRTFQPFQRSVYDEDDGNEGDEAPSEITPSDRSTNDQLMFVKTTSASRNVHRDSARKMYIVQVDDTPRSIAVVQLNDHLLENLIVEINSLLFREIYDAERGIHVKILPAGSMILLPNHQDIEEFRSRS